MSTTVVLSCGVGGLKAIMHALAIEHLLREAGVKVRARTGASGGALAAACASFTAVNNHGIPWLVERIQAIDENSLLDNDVPQQLLDKARTLLRLPKRRGDKALIGWYRGNGLLRAIQKTLGALGTIADTVQVVSTALAPETDPDAVPLAACAGVGQKIVRTYSATDGGNRLAELALALRASAAIPFVLRPQVVSGTAQEVDGGVVSLTTEEVGADLLESLGGEQGLLLISDMQALPSPKSAIADDVLEAGLLLARAVGAQLQHLNRNYAALICEKKRYTMLRLSPARLSFPVRQFETAAAGKVFAEYVDNLRKDAMFDAALKWLRDGA